MSGFTGMNPMQARADIENFQSSMYSIASYFNRAGSDLFTSLQKVWFSPRAVEFSQHFSSPLYNGTVKVIYDISDSIVEAAVNAYNTLADASGSGRLVFTPNNHGDAGSFGDLKEAGPNGEVGMDGELVRQIVQNFQNAVKNGTSYLDSLPTNLALYDNSGNLQVTFSNCVKSAKESIASITNDITNHLSTAVQNETTVLKSAVNNSVSALGGVETHS